ncbi:MAG: ribulose-phosphate 3-epimerase [bacterium]|nr:ribulose-phosphate 3-epimerase [bacterium]
MHIVPAILTDKKEELFKMIRQAEKFCPMSQIDIMDGKFVPTLSVSPYDLSEIRTSMKLEIHLMVERPIALLTAFKEAGAGRIIFHFESKDDPWDIIKETRALNLEVGIAVNPETTVREIEDFLLSVDQVLVMTVKPGYYGSPFLPEMMGKIAELKKKKGKFLVSVDGGININNVSDMKDAGVDLSCVGSGIFKGNPEENYKKLVDKISQPVFMCPKIANNIVNQ